MNIIEVYHALEFTAKNMPTYFKLPKQKLPQIRKLLIPSFLSVYF